MGMKYKKKTNMFVAYDTDGRAYDLVEYTEYEDVISIGNQKKTVELLKSLQTSDGLKVNKINGKTFDILSNDLKTGKDIIRVKRNKE